ncbi:serine hydrolase [Candidatus Poribacteria bacterium]|nr:serine hydrolase [Candidatus Poribacteria bacterium]
MMSKKCSNKFDRIREFITQKLVEMSVSSAAVAVAQEGEIIWEEGFGWADSQRRIKSNEHTMYSLASISKPITATGFMILKERGLVELDKPFNDYLDEAKITARIGKAEDATVRRVANHSSGMGLHYQFFCRDESYPRPPMDETIRRYAKLFTLPGERYQYCNLGYGLMDYAISRLSGLSYEDFMRTEVFLPLGMTHTSINIDPGLEDYQAIRYGSDGLPIPFYDFDHPGASAVYSSVHDLIRFGMFHLKNHLSHQKQIITDETIDEMQVPTADIDSSSGYGIGWRIGRNSEGLMTVAHTGGMGGVRTILSLQPEHGTAIAVLTNASSSLSWMIHEEILKVMFPDEIKKKEADKDESSEPEPFQPGDELRGKWSGNIHTYKCDIPLNIWFKESGDVHVQMENQLKTLVNNVTFKDNWIRGVLMGDIGTEDSNRRRYYLHLDMKLRGDVINGAIISISLPGEKMGNALSHWIEVTRETDGD